MWRGRERRTGGGRGRRGGGDSDGAGGPQARRGRGSRSHLLFFSSRGRHTEYWRDWSSDVCSSDLGVLARHEVEGRVVHREHGPDRPELPAPGPVARAAPALEGGARRHEPDLRLAGLDQPYVLAQTGIASCRESVKISVVAVSSRKS